MKKMQQQSNTEKSVKGNEYESCLCKKLKLENNKLKIRTIEYQRKFSDKNPAEIIADMYKDTPELSKKILSQTIDNFFKMNLDKPIRDNKKYYKRADITFKTVNKYFINGKLTNLRFIIDTTTSARGDRLKAKAQDASVYKNFGFPYIYLIVLPNSDYFIENGYANPEKEDKNCKTEIYNHNFCNLYKEENVSLIIQEKDLIDFLEYIAKRKEKDMDKLIENWKKYYFKDMYNKRKNEILFYKKQLIDEIIQLRKEK